MTFVRSLPLFVVLTAASLVTVDRASAVSMYVNVPGVAGVDPAPGYPAAMAVSSLTVTPNTLTVVKEQDAASPELMLAVANGTQLGTIDALLYNSLPAASPDATIGFFNPIASAYQTISATDEEVAFGTDNPLALFLEIPGIPGESNVPGHSNVIQIQSFQLTGNDFTIIKAQDSASDDLLVANAQGAVFSAARLLLYNTLPPGGVPDAVIEFHDVLISASQSLPNTTQPLEQHSFNFDTLTVPEPASALLFGCAIAGMRASGRRTRACPRK